MWEKIRVVFTIPELRQKILLTLLLLAIYRIGWQIPLPLVDYKTMTAVFAEGQGGLSDLFNQVAVFSASQLNQATIFGLGIMPYISASIIFQLLGSVYPPLEKLQKEGESGRKKINEYTRYATVLLCLGHSWFYLGYLMSRNLIYERFLVDGSLPLSWQLAGVLTMTAGTVFLMWLGEQIDEYGIGNGISLLIMAGILARMLPAGWEDIIKPVYERFLVDGSLPFSWQLGGVLTMTAGTVFLMWLGEQIDEYGIGNGISLLIMAGILARMLPAGWEDIIKPIRNQGGLGLGGGRGRAWHSGWECGAAPG
jgi:preprotein translocase subunit SecY